MASDIIPARCTGRQNLPYHDKRKQTDGKVLCCCLECGDEFWKFPSALAAGRGRYCSRQCSGAFKARAYKGRKGNVGRGSANPNWRGRRAPKPCPICGVVFNGVGKTCSAQCGQRLRAKTITGDGNPFRKVHPAQFRICKACGESYVRDDQPGRSTGSGRHYCSTVCYLKKRRISQRQLAIAQEIEGWGVRIELEKWFPWLISPKTNRRLRIDIYLSDQGAAIEYDGRHHREQTFNKDPMVFRRIVERDAEKDALLSEHGIRLLRVEGWPVDMAAVMRFILAGEEDGKADKSGTKCAGEHVIRRS